MEEQLKRIEEKLDIFLAAMSANPEFENFVKEGQLKLHLKEFKVKTLLAIDQQKRSKVDYIVEILGKYSEQHRVMLSTPKGFAQAFHCAGNAPDYAKEIIFELAQRASGADWNMRIAGENFIEDVMHKEGFCPLMKEQIVRVLGGDIDLETELEKERLRYLEENK